MNRTIIAAVAVSVLLAACSGAQKLPADGPKTASDVLAKAMARKLPKTMQGMSRLDSYVDGTARKADVLVRIERPDRAQFQALTPTLDLLAVLATDGKRFYSFERGADRCYVGDACPANMARLIPVALPPDQMVSAMLGRPPLLASNKRSLHWDGKRGAYRVHVGPAADGSEQDVWIRPGDFRFLAAVVKRGGKRVVSIAYAGHDEIAKGGPPKHMRMQITARKIDMSLTLRDIELNATIEADAFATACPTGTVAIELPCEASPAVLAPPPARSHP